MLDWLLGLGLGGGALAGLAAWFFGIPSFLKAIAPIIQVLMSFLSWYFTELWDGLRVIFKNTSTFVVIVTIAIASGYYGTTTVQCFDAQKPHQERLQSGVEMPEKKEFNPFDVR